MIRNRIRELRNQHGLSQAGLAARVGVSRVTINAIEASRWDPSLDLAFSIAHHLSTSVDALFDWEAAKGSPRSRRRRDG